jgi:DNA recombination protein RmuC
VNALPTTLTLALTALAALAVGALGAWLLAQRRVHALRETAIRLEAELAAERRTAEARERAFAEARGQLTNSFQALAAEALKHNSGEFLKLAQENLKQFQTHAVGELAQREKAVEGLVRPIREALEKTEAQVRAMEKERQTAYGSLTKHLETMADSQRRLHEETNNLVQALRRPEVRGQWGEMTLKRLAELAGMVEHCDFEQQPQVRTDEGAAQRPDMVVRMPDGRCIVVDAKTPLDAYLDAIKAGDDAARGRALERHARKVRDRVKELSAKAYWQQFAESPDFVVLFIPGDQFLSAALDADPRLVEDALASKVIIATPTSFVALLRAVAYGWRQEVLAENAERIRTIGEELYGRLVTFADALAKLGRSLDSSVGHFNRAVGSFESRVLPGARRFTELGLAAKKELPETVAIETRPRAPTSAATEDEPA